MSKLLAIFLLLLCATEAFGSQSVSGPREASLSWRRPTHYTDGSSITNEEIVYRIYWLASDGVMRQIYETSDLQVTLVDQPIGRQCYAVTAVIEMTGSESGLSGIGCKEMVFLGPTEGSIIRRE